MPFRSRLPKPSAVCLGILISAFGAARAEDPFLGQIKEIKCVNCKPGWVTLVVHDPIDTRDFELYLKDTDYNKIITPLPGKRIHDRDGQCFYWMERPKGKAKPAASPSPTPAAPKAGQAVSAKGGQTEKGGDAQPAGKSGTADSLDASAATASAPFVLPPLEEQGTPSACIRFYKQMK